MHQFHFYQWHATLSMLNKCQHHLASTPLKSCCSLSLCCTPNESKDRWLNGFLKEIQ
ncbi:hypothetical protein HanXRQr2_Chr03g0092571 [Helianthus annuus]|uniref:Uncharacterized protein n=1 Tax=Helianthus annuus TaxID=4232 RepID=A0A251V590_HELAN|nr:hypothetical protein HanXRQr2_Chr03g0092571 [Helianthus annuus]